MRWAWHELSWRRNGRSFPQPGGRHSNVSLKRMISSITINKIGKDMHVPLGSPWSKDRWRFYSIGVKPSTEVFGLNLKYVDGCFVATSLSIQDDVEMLRQHELKVLLEPEVFPEMIWWKEKSKVLLHAMIFFCEGFEWRDSKLSNKLEKTEFFLERFLEQSQI